MDERAVWIWLQQAFKPGSPMPYKISQDYPGGVREFWEGGPKLWNGRRDIRDSEAAALRDFSLGDAQARLEYAEKLGWQVLTPDCRKYPWLLRNIPDPPAVLYGKGELPELDSLPVVAVVGSRSAVPASLDAAKNFGYQLAAGGACVVSGGAKGVDAAALTGALSIPGAKMISVLPVSLDSSYVSANARLRSMICQKGGALLSEYFSQSAPDYGTFPIRNRLVTGLSKAVLIVQSRLTGGGPLYVSRALEQGREVLVWTGPRGGVQFDGNRKLLEEGATPVSSGEDLLAWCGGTLPEGRTGLEELMDGFPFPKPEPVLSLADSGAPMEPETRRVWEILSSQPQSLEQLADQSGMAAPALMSLLTEMELEGLAVSHPGKRFSRGRG